MTKITYSDIFHVCLATSDEPELEFSGSSRD
jgi:hypothetical protein